MQAFRSLKAPAPSGYNDGRVFRSLKAPAPSGQGIGVMEIVESLVLKAGLGAPERGFAARIDF